MYSLDELNDAQQQAVEHVDGPLLILAGPGSGKTRVVTQRIARMLSRGIVGQSILALTFTNKAADEMRQRVDKMVPSSGVWIGTFHRFCAKLLRRHAEIVGLSPNYTILDTSDSQLLLKRAVEFDTGSLGMYSVDDVGRAIGQAKSFGVTAEAFEARSGSPIGELVSRIYPLYRRQLQTANAVDFDDLLLHAVTILRECPEIRAGYDSQYRYVMVDEYQDTNIAQYGLVRMLNVDYPNVAVTGDPDQSIYGWRGANVENILSFERDYPSTQIVRLERNYRSTPEILRVADAVIKHNRRRRAKQLVAARESGDLPRVLRRRTQADEAETIAGEIAAMLAKGEFHGDDIAIFYRANALSRLLEKSLRGHGVPHQIVRGVSFFQRREIKDLIAYLQLLNNPRNDAAFLRIINVPTRGIGTKTVSRISTVAVSKNCCMLDAARSAELTTQLAARARRAVKGFVDLFDKLMTFVNAPVVEILGTIVTTTNYHDLLKSGDATSVSTGEHDRAANVRELLNDAHEFDEHHGESPGALEAYLEQALLVNDIDGWNDTCQRVTLMTLHASKGLEFPIVYIVGVEDGLLPHQRSKENGDIEEERRLFFVGLTRAKQQLTLSHVAYRARRGALHPAVPSPFLIEFRPEDVVFDDQVELLYDEYASQVSYEEPAIQLRVDSDSNASHAGQRAKPTITTAAAMLSTAPPSGISPPDRFEQGMLVEHEEHGLGKVVSLSGSGAKRRATIQFFSGSERKFVLAHAPIRPIRSTS
jgi:DNA helicase-2/ATP-dependent DNA helicase PcrA